MAQEPAQALEEIPQPPEHYYGFLGNLPDLDPAFAIKSIRRLADIYGPIYRLNLINRDLVVVSNFEYAKQVQDDDKFAKKPTGGLVELRPLIKDGLFSAFSDEPNWHKAHRTLVPVFGPMGVRKMFQDQLDIASQMILHWDRLGPNHALDTADTFTRLAFDTIGLCAFSYRFNNFYADKMHPFAQQMAESLVSAGLRAGRTSLENTLRIWSAQHDRENVQAMHKLCDDIIHDRMVHPNPEANDLLNTMLNVADPVTREKLDLENIRYQMCTFLIAGHETTSGTLAYLFYNLLKNPETLHKAQQEVDAVVGNNALELKHLNQLKYIDAAIKETLRLNGPIGGVVRAPAEDVILAGKYKIAKGTPVMTNFLGMHTDPAVWGNDAHAFRPERMYDFKSEAWKPFGIGVRSCIGRYFAEQEMIINVALILQRFQVEMADPSYDLKIKSTLTTKPDGFFIKVRRRPGKNMYVGLPGSSPAADAKHKESHLAVDAGKPKEKMTVFYGGNAGTCKAFAEDLQSNAPDHGYEVQVKTLDQAVEAIPTKLPVVIITSSYEGKPPDNAKKFVSWLEANKSNSSALEGVRFTCFGIGNGEWVSTYQKIPKTVNDLMSAMGAAHLCEADFADVKKDCTGEWENFTERLWTSLQESGHGAVPQRKGGLIATVQKHDAPSLLGGKDMSYGIVKSARSLGGLEIGPEKRELVVTLPEGMTYNSGDYLVVQPLNPSSVVTRVLAQFSLHSDDIISISGTRKAFLKSNQDKPIEAAVFFHQRVELSTTATVRQLETLQSYASSASDKEALSQLIESHDSEVIEKNYSLLDILEDHPSIELPLSAYIDFLKPLAPRQYSIASSPLSTKQDISQGYRATLLYDVHRSPAKSGHGRTFLGVASNYLASLQTGNRVHCYVRPTNVNFKLPSDTTVPVIMIAAGTGLAPMRGFIQERAAYADAGSKPLGPALLYFGCRDYEKDFIYREELSQMEADGVVKVRPVFSRSGPRDAKFKYTHERIWDEREELKDLFRNGAKIFLCGSASRLAKSTAEVLKKIWLENRTGVTERDAEEWLMKQKEDRYVTDVYD